MTENIIVRLYRAQSVGDETPHLNITTNTEEFPDYFTSLEELMELHRTQAKVLVDALYKTLPGGTLDQVLRELLERKASQLVVRF